MSETEQVEVKKTEDLQQVKPPQTEVKKTDGSSNTPIQQPTDDSPQDRDWRKWKEARQREREEAAKVEAARIKAENEAAALKAALEAVVNKPNNYQQQNSYSDDGGESEEVRIDRRVAEALAKREAEARKQKEIEDRQSLPVKLVNTFKDFNNVCTQENIDYLDYHHPELAKALGRNKDSFEGWADIYSAIKRYIPNPESLKDAKRADKNLAKPQSPTHSGMQPGAQQTTVKLDEKRRAENWARMQKTLKGIS